MYWKNEAGFKIMLQ